MNQQAYFIKLSIEVLHSIISLVKIQIFMECSLKFLQSRMLLQPELVLEDVSQDHARKTVRFFNLSFLNVLVIFEM